MINNNVASLIGTLKKIMANVLKGAIKITGSRIHAYNFRCFLKKKIGSKKNA